VIDKNLKLKETSKHFKNKPVKFFLFFRISFGFFNLDQLLLHQKYEMQCTMPSQQRNLKIPWLRFFFFFFFGAGVMGISIVKINFGGYKIRRLGDLYKGITHVYCLCRRK